MTYLLPLEAELPIPAWGFGIIAFALLLTAMLIVVNVGNSRPHS